MRTRLDVHKIVETVGADESLELSRSTCSRREARYQDSKASASLRVEIIIDR